MVEKYIIRPFGIRMLKKIKLLLNDFTHPNKSLDQIKELLLKYSIVFLVVLGFFPIIIAIIEAVIFKQFLSAGIYLLIYLLTVSNLVFYKKLTFQTKALFLLGVIYTLAIHNLLLWGVSGASIPLLILFCILATVLMGLRNGLISIIFALLPMTGVGFLMITGMIEVAVDVYTISVSLISWLTAIAVMVMIAMVAVLSFGLIEQNLLRSIGFIQQQAGKLKQTNRQLSEDIKKRKAVEQELRGRIKFDILINKISSQFLQTGFNNIEKELEEVLTEMGSNCSFTYIFLTLFSKNKQGYKGIYEYNPNHYQEYKKDILSISPDSIPLQKNDNDLNHFFLTDISGLNAMETVSEINGEFFLLPLTIESQFVGLIGARKERGQKIPEFDYNLLEVVKNIFANVIKNYLTEIEKNKIQEQLIQSQKLESIGNLAAGIAHDFNNLLTVIMGNADFLRYQLDMDVGKNDLVEEIIKASQQAAELTKKMLIFSRKEAMNFQPLNLNNCLMDLRKILQRLIGENIQISLNLFENLPAIRADKSNIEQLLLNLTSNARDAMPAGGGFHITTGRLHINAKNIDQIQYSRPGDFVVLTVEDSGCGIDMTIIDKIFDPFFTTKEVGKGTGLGLSVVYGIVKKHDGWINVYSEPNHGTVFRIYFPVAGQKDKHTFQEPEKKAIKLENISAQILIIEDNPRVLKFCKNLLIHRKFTVLTAESGAAAEIIWKEKKDTIDLVISDVILPDINGLELIEKLNIRKGNTKLLMISGYTGESVQKKIFKDKGLHFLSKPFTNEEFIAKIVELLNQS